MAETALMTRDENPMAMVRLMVEKGSDPDQLGKMMELAEKWQANQARRAFTDAMAAVQADMPTVVRDACNSHTGSRYAKLETVMRQCKPVCAAHGLTVSFSEGEHPREGWVRIIAQVRHTDGHVEVYHRDGPMDNKGPKGGDVKSELHGVASTVTYLSRHLFCGIFNVTIADSDTDGNQPGAMVNEQQAVEIEQLLEQAGANVDRFKDWAGGIATIAELPMARFTAARDMLLRKIGGKPS